MSVNTGEVNEKLQIIHRERNRFAYIPHIIIALTSTYFQRQELLKDDYWWQALLVIGLGIAMRVVTFNVIYDSWCKDKLWAKIFNYAALIILALGWAFHFGDVYFHYGGGSANTSNTLIFVAGLVTGTSVSMAAHRPSYYVFSTVMCVFPIVIYLTDVKAEGGYVTLYILIFYFFNLSILRSGHKQLKRLAENEIEVKLDRIRFKELIDSVPGFVGVIDQNLECTMANKATLAIYPNIVGKKLGEVDEDGQWEQAVIDFMRSDKAMAVMETHTVKAGRNIWTVLNVNRNTDGGAIIISIVVNELMEAKQKLHEQEAKARYSAKLASLGEMAAGIAHEVNNPLTIIQGAALLIKGLVVKDPLDRESVVELSSKLVDTSNRISKTIKSLKNLSRNGEKDPIAPVDLEKMLHQCLDLSHQRFVHHGVELKLPQFDSPVIFSGREVQLSQVLVNLLVNAIDAVKKVNQKWIEVRFEKHHHGLSIYVTDSGPGVPLEIQNKIMEPFFTTKDVNEGTGLGLSISKAIIQDHKGELSLVQNSPHTTFKIYLPS